MRLYHATNMWSAKQMQKYGMGLDAKDYQQLAEDIAKDCDVPVAIFDAILKSIAKDSEANGGVSFMPTLVQATRLLHYGSFGGEWRGSTVERMLKRAARAKGVRVADLRHLTNKYTGNESKPCIVVVDLPTRLISNKDSIGKGVELYTTSKVSEKLIVSVIVP